MAGGAREHHRNVTIWQTACIGSGGGNHDPNRTAPEQSKR